MLSRQITRITGITILSMATVLLVAAESEEPVELDPFFLGTYGQKTYYTMKNPVQMTWMEAWQYCRDFEFNLVGIESGLEQKQITALLFNKYPGSNFWTSGIKLQSGTQNSYKWLSTGKYIAEFSGKFSQYSSSLTTEFIILDEHSQYKWIMKPWDVSAATYPLCESTHGKTIAASKSSNNYGQRFFIEEIFEGHKYTVVISENLSWTDAFQSCTRMNSELVYIDNIREYAFVTDFISRAVTQAGLVHKDTKLWTSGTDAFLENQFIWLNSKSRIPIQKSMWINIGNQPDNWKGQNPAGENCAVFTSGFNDTEYKLNDRDCREECLYCCKAQL